MPALVSILGEKTSVAKFLSYATIGRSSRCTMSVRDIKVSRVHCEVIEDDGDFILIDLHSQNGTKVNGSPITEAILQDGDEISVGKYKIVFHLPESMALGDITGNSQQQDPLPELQKTLAVKKISAKDLGLRKK